jgi:hypothetical protein
MYFLNSVYVKLVGITMFVVPLIDKCSYNR